MPDIKVHLSDNLVIKSQKLVHIFMNRTCIRIFYGQNSNWIIIYHFPDFREIPKPNDVFILDIKLFSDYFAGNMRIGSFFSLEEYFHVILLIIVIMILV